MKKIKENTIREELAVYKAENVDLALEVRVEDETIWLTQKQMSVLFQKGVPTINEHIRNVFKDGELTEISVIRKFRITARDGKAYETNFYNLDVIISVGYRVKSYQGTKFRIWATQVLKEQLLKRRSPEKTPEKEISSVVKLIGRVAETFELNKEDALGLIKVIEDYSYALDLLDQYDYQKLTIGKSASKEEYQISYDDAIDIIEKLKTKFGGSSLFGKQKDKSFQSTVATIYQTFGKKELYPSVEEKGANLLYLTIKNHSFIDGNKRIAASLFLWYLQQNKCLYKPTGEKRIADNALVALCLMIAQSNPKEKDVMIKVIVNLINKNN